MYNSSNTTRSAQSLLAVAIVGATFFTLTPGSAQSGSQFTVNAGIGGTGTYQAGYGKCPGNSTRVGRPFLPSQWAVDRTGGSWKPAFCTSPAWLSKNDPTDCRFTVYLSDQGVRNVSYGFSTAAELMCKVAIQTTPGAPNILTYEQRFAWSVGPFGSKEDKIVDPHFGTRVKRRECFGRDSNGNNCYFAGWVSDDESDPRCKIHIGASAFSYVSCEATVKADPVP